MRGAKTPKKIAFAVVPFMRAVMKRKSLTNFRVTADVTRTHDVVGK